MIPAYNKKRCAAFPIETGIHFRRKTDFFPEEDTTKSYLGFEPEPTRLQAEIHSHHTGWATSTIPFNSGNLMSSAKRLSASKFHKILHIIPSVKAQNPTIG
ncbi:poly polymerase [Trichonephila clavipes]|nr:poly polymerase [Trichonephila clavipes]